MAVIGFRRLPKAMRRRIVRIVAPSYTLGAIVLLRDGDDRILLLHQPPASGWSLPGGLLDRREAPVVGAARELREETGVEVLTTALRSCTPNALVYPFIQQVDCVFTATVDAGSTTIRVDGTEVRTARWFEVDQLPQLTSPTARLLGTYGIGPHVSSARR
jgi:ADP-ribose pyrophosphatase YjhB (NUDIX family)